MISKILGSEAPYSLKNTPKLINPNLCYFYNFSFFSLIESAREMLKVFVYGTLKPGESNYQQYCADKVVEAEKAIALGQLFALPVGYPAMTSGDTPVQGYLLTFADADVLQYLDELEDYDPQRSPEQNLYNRKLIETKNPTGQFLGLAWAYFMTPHRVRRLGGVLVPSGWWSGCGLLANSLSYPGTIN